MKSFYGYRFESALSKKTLSVLYGLFSVTLSVYNGNERFVCFYLQLNIGTNLEGTQREYSIFEGYEKIQFLKVTRISSFLTYENIQFLEVMKISSS